MCMRQGSNVGYVTQFRRAARYARTVGSLHIRKSAPRNARCMQGYVQLYVEMNACSGFNFAKLRGSCRILAANLLSLKFALLPKALV